MSTTVFVEADETVIEVVEETTLVLTEPDVLATILTVGEQGPAGPRGLPGVSGGQDITKYAVGPIGGQRVVKLSGTDGVEYASADEVTDIDLVLGISLHAAVHGAQVQVARTGQIDDSSWNWTPEQPVFLGLNGVLVQTLPLGAVFLQRIGVAVSPTAMYIDVQLPILF